MQLNQIYYTLSVMLVIVSCASSPRLESGRKKIDYSNPVEIGSQMVGTRKIFGNVEQQEAALSLYPKANHVSLEFKFQSNKNFLYLDKQARDLFISGIQRYLNDFELKNLINGSKKSEKIYGEAEAVHRWGLFSINAESYPAVRFGYVFVKDSPFFIVTIPAAKNALYSPGGPYKIESSVEIVLYFTRSQLESFQECIGSVDLQNFDTGTDKSFKPDVY